MRTGTAHSEIVEHERAVEKALREDAESLRRTHNRTQFGAITETTPLDILAAAEKPQADEWELRLDTTHRIFAFLLSHGPHPAKILRQIYALGAHVKAPGFELHALYHRSLVVVNSPATHRWLMEKIVAGDAAAVAFREKEIDRALSRLKTRTGYAVTTERVPLNSILAADDSGSDEWETARETVERILAYISSDGYEASDVLRLTFALGSHMSIEPFSELTLREKKMLLGGSHGTHHWLAKKKCEDPLRRAGARSWKAPGQKNLKSRRRYSHAQAGNTNRKHGRK